MPLADTTIYELERSGDFPRRFSLTLRCVVWDLSEAEAWIRERIRASDEGQSATGPDVHLRRTRRIRRG